MATSCASGNAVTTIMHGQTPRLKAMRLKTFYLSVAAGHFLAATVVALVWWWREEYFLFAAVSSVITVSLFRRWLWRYYRHQRAEMEAASKTP
jgi:membrane protein implicated in regulation of membrane protease activity